MELEESIKQVIAGKAMFTADDLHVLEPMIAERKIDLRIFGNLLKSLQRQGYIMPVGYCRSQRRQCHGRPVIVWQVINNVQYT